MSDKPLARRARVHGEHYTWRSLWVGASTLQERGRLDESGSWWATLSAMLLAYTALEAYLNYLGPSLCPGEWTNEKAFFSKGKYRGTLGKLALLLDRCGLPWDPSRQPWQTLKEINKRRDLIAHPRNEHWDEEIAFLSPGDLRSRDSAFYALVDEKFVDRAMAAIEAVCDPLHVAAARILEGGPAFGPSAFHGMVGHSGGSILD